MKAFETVKTYLTYLMVLAIAAGLLSLPNSARANETFSETKAHCESALNQINKTPVINDTTTVTDFTIRFRKILHHEMLSLGMTDEDLIGARIVEVKADAPDRNQKRIRKIYIFSKGHKAWWFVEFKKFGFVRQVAGPMTTEYGSEELKRLVGRTVTDEKKSIHYEFDESTKTFVRLSVEVTNQFRKFAEVLAASGDGTEEILLKQYGTAIITAAQKQTIKLVEIGPGKIIKLRARSWGPDFFLYLPNDYEGQAYIFLKTDDGVPHIEPMSIERNQSTRQAPVYYLNREVADVSLKTLFNGVYDTGEKVMVNEKTTPIVIYRQKDRDPSMFAVLTREKLVEIKRALIDKDRASEQFESAPYAHFVENELQNFIESGFVNSQFEDLKNIELLGEGSSAKDASQKFNILKYGNTISGITYFYYTRQHGQTVFGKYHFGRLPTFGAGHLAVRDFEKDQFYKIFGKKVILPTGKILTINPYSADNFRPAIAYQITEQRSNIDQALEELKKATLTDDREAQDD